MKKNFTTEKICPLCKIKKNFIYYAGDKRDNFRKYYRCKNCDLIFVSKDYFLSIEEERNRYYDHNNSPNDDGYRKFLSKIFDKIKPYINESMIGLDYGCGPGPTLSIMFKEANYNMKIYDPFFYDNKHTLNNKYDFITCTEAFEHFHDPEVEIRKLVNLLNNNGILGIMTNMTDNVEEFSKWYYKNDLTHVVYYSQKTFRWISCRYNLKNNYLENNIIILQKK